MLASALRPRPWRRGLLVGSAVAVTLPLGVGLSSADAADANDPAASSAAAPSTIWDQLGGSSTHSGSELDIDLLDPESAGTLGRSWSAPVGGEVRSSPVVRSRRVYVGSQDKAVVAVDGTTGAQLWRTPVSEAVTSAPATDGATVFAVTRDCTVYALSPESGEIRWQNRYEECSDFEGGLLLREGKLFLPSPSGVLRAYVAETGAPVWSAAQASAPSETTPTATGSIVISTWDGGAVTAVDAATGSQVWTAVLPGNARSSASVSDAPPAVDGQVAASEPSVYVGDDQGGLNALSRSTGALLWRTELAPSTSEPIVRSAPAVDAERVYVHVATHAPAGGELVAVDKTTGARAWSRATGYATSSPAVANGVVYSSATAGELQALSAEDGRVLWSRADSGSASSPAPADDGIYLGLQDGTLTRYGLGGEVEEAPDPAPVPEGSSSSAPSGQPMPLGDLGSWDKVFSDDFTGDTISSKWSRYSGRPGSDPDAQWARSHVVVDDGKVALWTYRDSAYGGKWTSGAINNSRSGVAARSGRYDIRMRADRAKGINLAALLWPYEGGWPPEIDFVEDRDGDRADFTTTIHYKNSSTSHGMIHGKKIVDMTQWHTYGVRWTPGKVVYTVDGEIWKTVYSSNVPSVRFELAIQTNAVTRGAVKPDSSTPSRSKVEIDWVVGYVPF